MKCNNCEARLSTVCLRCKTPLPVKKVYAPNKADRKKIDAYGRVKNIAPSRATADELRRLALLLRAQSGMGAYDEEANMLDELAETLLDIRQAVRGGVREKPVRNWNER